MPAASLRKAATSLSASAARTGVSKGTGHCCCRHSRQYVASVRPGGSVRPGPQAGRVEHAVADLGQRPASVHELVAEHDSCTDACRDRQVGDVGPAVARAQLGLADGRQVGVVGDGHRDPGSRGAPRSHAGLSDRVCGVARWASREASRFVTDD